MTRNSKPDILEWTVTEAPDPSEIESLSPPVWEPASTPPELDAHTSEAQTHSRHFQISRRIWLILGTAIVGLLLGAGVFTLWNRYRIRGQVERFVAAEERAALAGDTQQIRQLTDNGDPGWLSEHAALTEINQAAPAPLSILWALPEPGTAQSLRSIASDTVQVDVARRYIAPDGATVTFALPQFYRYTHGQWKRIAPPKTVWGEETTRPGLRVNVTYYPVDQEFAVELSDYLEGMLAQACAAWVCPDDLKLHVRLSERNASAPSDYASPLFQGSLLISLFYGDLFSALYDSAPTFASPHALGHPADAASADLLKRTIALKVLTQVAHWSAPDNGGNGFLYALVERMAVRLELEPPRVTEMYFANSGLSAEDVWNNQFPTESPYPAAERLRAALAILNRLLQDQPADTDIKLFNSLSPQHVGVGASEFLDSDDTMTRLFSIGLSLEADPAAWLSKGLGIPFAEAKARLRAATEDPYPVKLLTADPREFTLTCPDGLAVMSRGDAEPTPLLSAYLPDGLPFKWSPDGKRLMLMMNLTGQWAVADFEAGALIWPPRTSPDNSDNFIGWASDTIVAYQTWSRFNPALTFFDLASSRRIFPQLPPEPLLIDRYILSPDKSQAALILRRNDQSYGGRGLLALMPPLGGSVTPLDEGAFNPVWSPSGDALAYLRILRVVPGAVSLNLADPTTAMTREVWSTRRLGIPFSNDVQIVWSPTGDLIALTSNVFTDDSSQSWIFLVRPDGSGARILAQQEENAAIYPADFSADGKYLAVLRYGPRSWWFSATLIYDTATGELKRTLPNTMPWWSNNAWSPTGHEMVVSSYEGVYLLAEPGDPNRPPEKLTGERCYGVMWNPK